MGTGTGKGTWGEKPPHPHLCALLLPLITEGRLCQGQSGISDKGVLLSCAQFLVGKKKLWMKHPCKLKDSVGDLGRISQ